MREKGIAGLVEERQDMGFSAMHKCQQGVVRLTCEILYHLSNVIH